MGFARYKIVYMETPTPDTRILRLKPVEAAEGTMPRPKPGQFVFIHILDKAGKSVARKPYSIASSPDSPYMEFCIKMVHGAVTGRLEGMKIGDALGIEGPLGNFFYDGEKKAAFVAGGVGVAPFIGMLRYIAERKMDGRFVLFYSTKTRDSVLYMDELAELARKNPNIKVVMTLTRETPRSWKGECGRLDREMIRKHLGEAKDYHWWICGPVEMVNSIKNCLAGLGKDVKDIRMEGWG